MSTPYIIYTLSRVVVVAEIFSPQVATDARGEMLETDRYLSSLQKWLFYFSSLTNF